MMSATRTCDGYRESEQSWLELLIDQPDREHLRDGPVEDGKDQRLPVAKNGARHGVQAVVERQEKIGAGSMDQTISPKLFKE